MSKKKVHRIQLYDGEWSPIADKGQHECCHCSLTHNVKYKFVNGVMFECWTVNKSETAKARRASRKVKR